MNGSLLFKSIAGIVVAGAALAAPVEAALGPIAVQVRVHNVDPRGGPVRAAMFDRARWLSSQAVASAEAPAGEPSVSLNLTAPSAGLFGFAVYQDVNGDGRLNRNLIGLPSEPTGFSNGTVIRFGPPDFDAAAVSLTADGVVVTVRLS